MDERPEVDKIRRILREAASEYPADKGHAAIINIHLNGPIVLAPEVLEWALNLLKSTTV